MKVMIDIRKSQLDSYPYKTTPLGKLYFPRVNEIQEDTKIWDDFGVDDSFFGGNIHKIASVKGKPFYIIVNRQDETLGILHRFEDLKDYNRNELLLLCELQGITINPKDSKDYIIEKLTRLKT